MRVNKRIIKKFLNNDNFRETINSLDELPASSWLFVTRNRCPFSDPEKNPLVWSFQTLINNDFYKIKDFVVVDDNSGDYTKDCVKWLSKKYHIEICYIKNNKRMSCSTSRKIGLKYVKNNLVFMGDDDCLYSQYFLIGSILTYKILKEKRHNESIAIINLPVYERRLYPEFAIEKNNIGKVMINKTFFYHEFDKFPLEYLMNPHYIDANQTILSPMKVDTFKGVNLCDKRLIEQAGSYLNLEMWSSSYSEHIELSYKLKIHGFSIYHQPDPKFSCLHLKYGASSRDKFDKRYRNKKINGLKYPLGKMVLWSKVKRENTGARLDDYFFYETEIGSFLSFYLKISDSLGLRFVKNQYKIFVENHLVFSTTPSHAINSKLKRKRIFLAGVKKGIEATEIQTGKSYKKFLQKISSQINL